MVLGRLNNHWLWLRAWAWLLIGAGLMEAHFAAVRSALAPAANTVRTVSLTTGFRRVRPTWTDHGSLILGTDGVVRADRMSLAGEPQGIGFWKLSASRAQGAFAPEFGRIQFLTMSSEWTCTLDASVWKSSGLATDEATWAAVRKAVDGALANGPSRPAPIETRALAHVQRKGTIRDHAATIQREFWTVEQTQWHWPHVLSNVAGVAGPLMVLGGLVLLLVPSARERGIRARAKGLCPHCRYDLMGRFERVCSECGKDPKAD